MRSGSQIIVAGVAVLLAILAFPACADIWTVPSGGTVFIGEEGLDITATGIVAGDEIGWWGPTGTPGSTPAQQKITVSDPSWFYVSPVSFSGYTGPWFTTSGKKLVFYVKDPTLSIRFIDDSRDFDATGKWVPRGDQVSFRIETNMVDMTKRPGVAGAPVTIYIKSPDGGRMTSVYTAGGGVQSLEDLPVSTSPYMTRFSWDTGNSAYKGGTYTIWADATANNIDTNYYVVGKTVTPRDAQGELEVSSVNPSIKSTTGTPVKTVAVSQAPSSDATKSTTPVVAKTVNATVSLTTLETAPPPTSPVTTVGTVETTSTTPPVPVSTTKTPGFSIGTALPAVILVIVAFTRKQA